MAGDSLNFVAIVASIGVIAMYLAHHKGTVHAEQTKVVEQLRTRTDSHWHEDGVRYNFIGGWY